MSQDYQAKFLLLIEQSDGDDFLSEVIMQLEWLRKELAVFKIELLLQPLLSTSQPKPWQDWIESQYGQAQLNLWRDHPSTFWQYASSGLQTGAIGEIFILARNYPAKLAAEALEILASVDAGRVLYLLFDHPAIAEPTDGCRLIPLDDPQALIRHLAAITATQGPPDPPGANAASFLEDDTRRVAHRYRSWPPAADGATSEPAPEPPPVVPVFNPSALEPVQPAASKAEAPEPSEDWTEVRLGVSTPSELGPGDEFVARFAAYTPAFKEEVERVFKQEAPSSPPRLDLESSRWKKGARVTVSLRAQHIQIDNPVQTFDWNGEKNILRFDARVLPDANARVLILKFDIAVEGLSLLSLRPEIQLSATPGSVASASVLTEKRAPHTAFASYAHADKVEVFNRISSVVSFTGMDVFTDDVSIIPGEQWRARLESEIKNRDVFLLFWSRHAQDSTYVDWEWRTALTAKREIIPQALEPAEVAPPPKELSELQFGGVYERLISSLRKP